jgi:hypothetical protein
MALRRRYIGVYQLTARNEQADGLIGQAKPIIGCV